MSSVPASSTTISSQTSPSASRASPELGQQSIGVRRLVVRRRDATQVEGIPIVKQPLVPGSCGRERHIALDTAWDHRLLPCVGERPHIRDAGVLRAALSCRFGRNPRKNLRISCDPIECAEARRVPRDVPPPPSRRSSSSFDSVRALFGGTRAMFTVTEEGAPGDRVGTGVDVRGLRTAIVRAVGTDRDRALDARRKATGAAAHSPVLVDPQSPQRPTSPDCRPPAS